MEKGIVSMEKRIVAMEKELLLWKKELLLWLHNVFDCGPGRRKRGQSHAL
jgi:hypothetical protein